MAIKLSDYELGWLIGVLEGEGYFGYHLRSQQVQINMTDEDVMNTVAILFGKLTGKMHTPTTVTNNRDNCKEAFRLAITGESARIIMRAIVPYMHVRRRAKIWQSLNGHVSKQKTLKELGIDILDLVKKEQANG